MPDLPRPPHIAVRGTAYASVIPPIGGLKNVGCRDYVLTAHTSDL